MKDFHIIEDRVNTSDNWCPTREDGTVSVTLIINNTCQEDDHFKYRVVVSGEDDLLVYRDFYEQQQLHSAYNLFHCLLSHDDLTLDDCHNLSLKS